MYHLSSHLTISPKYTAHILVQMGAEESYISEADTYLPKYTAYQPSDSTINMNRH
jgi:hypothetical protein